ncbi:barrier-to-autointegration factor-like protein isoform X2 [Alligator mississippiensis]|uniref:barrier-to-autointegration factor-like protein isoform X2 n=1 Tax=Alligator mississippiensis TaxID=8496 RepID=UPI0009073C7F|nr:barrier-to-autointegration factor-like protein isoform X2 [Alligator mississippiensis]
MAVWNILEVRMMAIRTQKFNVFVSEPMGDKDITKVDGINDDLGMKLAAKGFNKAYILLGQFLLLKKDSAVFQRWLKGTYGASPTEAQQCASCLLEWCCSFL